MVKTLTKHGNSWALVIDKAIMELLRIQPDSPLEITTDGKSLVISPAGDQKRRQKFESVLDKTNRKYAKALKKLSELKQFKFFLWRRSYETHSFRQLIKLYVNGASVNC